MPDMERYDLDECDEDIAALYLKTAAHQIKRITAAIHAKSMANVQRLAHKLAGSSGFLGLKIIAKFLGELEKAAARGDSKEAVRLLDLIKEEFGQIQRRRTSAAPRSRSDQTEAPLPALKKKAKIFIVDDHPLIREGLVRLITLQPDLNVCGHASTTHEALKAIPAAGADLVILDITLAGSDGMGLIKDMKLRSLKSFILVLSMHEESLYAERALKAGAKGYIMKQEPPKELLKAIHRVLYGEIYLSEKMEAKMLHKIADSGADAKTATRGIPQRPRIADVSIDRPRTGHPRHRGGTPHQPQNG